MWKQNIDDGKKALGYGNLPAAEQCFKAGLEEARDQFEHTDPRIPQTFALLGQTLLLQKKVEEARPFLKHASQISASIKQTSAAIATADYLWAYIDTTANNAEERRRKTLTTLQKFLDQAQINQLTKSLTELFTVKTKPAVDQKSENKPSPKPEQKTEQKAQQTPPPPKPEEKPLQKTEQKTPVKPEQNLEIEVEEKSEYKPSPEEFTKWADQLQRAFVDARSPLVLLAISGYVNLHDLLWETLRLYEPQNPAVADHLEAMADVAVGLGLHLRAEQLLLRAIQNSQDGQNPSHLRSAKTKLKLAKLYQQIDSFDQALFYYDEALPIIYDHEPHPTLDKESYRNSAVAELLDRRDTIKYAHIIIAQLVLLNQVPANNEQREENFNRINQLVLQASALLAGLFEQDHSSFQHLYRAYANALFRTAPIEYLVLQRCVQRYVDRVQAMELENRSYLNALDNDLPPIPDLRKLAESFGNSPEPTIEEVMGGWTAEKEAVERRISEKEIARKTSIKKSVLTVNEVASGNAQMSGKIVLSKTAGLSEESAAAEKTEAAEKIAASEKAAATEKAAREKEAADRQMAETAAKKLAAENAEKERLEKEKVAQDKATAKKLAAEKEEAERAAFWNAKQAEKKAAENKEAEDAAQWEAAEKAAAERASKRASTAGTTTEKPTNPHSNSAKPPVEKPSVQNASAKHAAKEEERLKAAKAESARKAKEAEELAAYEKAAWEKVALEKAALAKAAAEKEAAAKAKTKQVKNLVVEVTMKSTTNGLGIDVKHAFQAIER
ncbi:MAG: hypothetical protein K2X81_13365, partial [Candidatus Obscuribacterales bacterium]|nr:hypothetical protein [Candidatus Obscuribacterales bacterium]